MTRYVYCQKHRAMWSMAHSPTLAADGQAVYLVCGFGGCQTRIAVPVPEWEAEEARRRAARAAEGATRPSHA